MAGYVYHVLNGAKGRLPIFHQDGDQVALERILGAALAHVPGRRRRAYGLLANPWHWRRWPRHDGALADCGHSLTRTHTQRWHGHSHDVGRGHLSQGRFQSLAVAQDEPFLRLGRYGSATLELAEALGRWNGGKNLLGKPNQRFEDTKYMPPLCHMRPNEIWVRLRGVGNYGCQDQVQFWREQWLIV